MDGIKLDYSKSGFEAPWLNVLQKPLEEAHQTLHEGTGPGGEYTGWVDWPAVYDEKEKQEIEKAADWIRANSEVFVVIGIGGSYLGAKSAIEALNHKFYNQLPEKKRKGPQIYFAGNGMSGSYMSELMELIGEKSICVNAISKSGTTTEPAIAFRIFKAHLEKKYGKEEAKKRIFVTTDKEKGALLTLARTEGYTRFVIPSDIGGRYSVLTPVGLLPIAVSGIDISDMMAGARDAWEAYKNVDIYKNPCYQYAVLRHLLYKTGKKVEIMVTYEPHLASVSEWWKQLYGESDGKDDQGLFPTAVNFSADLHSMGQYIQDGERHIFETVIRIGSHEKDVDIPYDDNNLDGLNYLAGKTMNFANGKAFEGTVLAHVDGGVPNIVVNVPKRDAYHYGYMVYFFEKACGIGGYLAKINPFNQPGVEAYKKNMFALLEKPGYEELRNTLLKRL